MINRSDKPRTCRNFRVGFACATIGPSTLYAGANVLNVCLPVQLFVRFEACVVIIPIYIYIYLFIL